MCYKTFGEHTVYSMPNEEKIRWTKPSDFLGTEIPTYPLTRDVAIGNGDNVVSTSLFAIDCDGYNANTGEHEGFRTNHINIYVKMMNNSPNDTYTEAIHKIVRYYIRNEITGELLTEGYVRQYDPQNLQPPIADYAKRDLPDKWRGVPLRLYLDANGDNPHTIARITTYK